MKECKESAIVKQKTQWLFVNLTEATVVTTLRSDMKGYR